MVSRHNICSLHRQRRNKRLQRLVLRKTLLHNRFCNLPFVSGRFAPDSRLCIKIIFVYNHRKNRRIRVTDSFGCHIFNHIRHLSLPQSHKNHVRQGSEPELQNVYRTDEHKSRSVFLYSCNNSRILLCRQNYCNDNDCIKRNIINTKSNKHRKKPANQRAFSYKTIN